MKRLITLTLAAGVLLGSLPSDAQNYSMAFGGTNNEYCYDAAMDNGNVYITGVGASYSTEAAALILAKVNSAGQLQWAKQYEAGTAAFGMTWATVIKVYNGELYFSAYTDDFGAGTNKDIILGKADTLGNLLWTERIGWDGHDRAYDFCLLNNEVYVIGQENQIGNGGLNRIIIAKYSSNGVFRWLRFYGNNGLHFGYGIAPVGQYLVATGFTNGYGAGDNDGLIMMLDTAGAVQWGLLLQSPGNENLYSVNSFNDHEFTLVGETDYNTNGGTDAVLIRMDTSGFIKAARKMGTSVSDYARTSVIRGDHLLVSGWRADADADSYLLEVDRKGNYLNAVKIGASDGTEKLRALDADDSHIAVAGYSDAGSLITAGNGGIYNDIFVERIDQLNSDLCDSVHIAFDTLSFWDLHFVALSISDSLTTISSSPQSLIVNNLTLNEVQDCSYPDITEDPTQAAAPVIYPNPVTDVLHINNTGQEQCSISIVDAFGRSCYFSNEIPVNGVDLSTLPAGLYLVRLTTPGGSITRKLIKLSAH